MALYSSDLFSKVSGSMDGVTFSHNKGGKYIRSRSTPTNPSSPNQTAVREAMACLVANWNDALTPAERSGWDTYADNVAVTSPIGETVYNSGQNWFVGNNLPRVYNDQPVIMAAPTTFNLGYIGEFDNAEWVGGPEFNIDVMLEGIWNANDLGFLSIQQGLPQNPSVNFFKGPYRQATVVNGNSSTPVTGTITLDNTMIPYPGAVGQKCWWRLRSSSGDGRLSSPSVFTTIRQA